MRRAGDGAIAGSGLTWLVDVVADWRRVCPGGTGRRRSGRIAVGSSRGGGSRVSADRAGWPERILPETARLNGWDSRCAAREGAGTHDGHRERPGYPCAGG